MSRPEPGASRKNERLPDGDDFHHDPVLFTLPLLRQHYLFSQSLSHPLLLLPSHLFLSGRVFEFHIYKIHL